MHETQKAVMRQSFYAGVLQTMVLLKHKIADIPSEEEATDVMESIFQEGVKFFKEETKRQTEHPNE